MQTVETHLWVLHPNYNAIRFDTGKANWCWLKACINLNATQTTPTKNPITEVTPN